MGPTWINVKDGLPNPDIRVLRYDSEINSSQEKMAITIVDGSQLKYAEDITWWCHIPEVPVPLKTF